jgi:hypothetical protein
MFFWEMWEQETLLSLFIISYGRGIRFLWHYEEIFQYVIAIYYHSIVMAIEISQ